MQENIYTTPLGDIHYWIERADESRYTLVFLPGLTADHRLFDKQIEAFKGRYSVLVWDAPGHASSRPFDLSFTLADKARWLKAILEKESIQNPILIGQSMGGYVAQSFMQEFPGTLKGFISIDSAPLQRRYVTRAEIGLLKRTEPLYRWFPWKLLLQTGASGCAVSAYGRQLMHDMMQVYDGDQAYYARLSGHGFRMLAQAMEADLPYRIDCPALLICGEKDQAGSTKRYNKAWHRISGIPIEWIPDAGHNSNTDQPERLQTLIEAFIRRLDA